MIKYILAICVVLKSFIGDSQGIPQNFVHKDGEKLGRWLVKDIPNNIISCCGTNQGQFLIFFPPAYSQGKKCGIGIWQGGKGETRTLDVTEVFAGAGGGSLCYMINNGLTPYSILPNKDTLWHVVVAIHNNFQSSYRTKLSTIIPYILDSIVKKYDPNYVWASGLSEGGAGTWGIFMLDSVMSKRVKFNFALANGGYDDDFVKLQPNLLAAIRNGVVFIPYIGNQDPGFNSFQAYNTFLKANAPNQYFPRFITNGTHSANVWDVPWKSRGFWDSLGAFGYKPTTTIPPPVNNPPSNPPPTNPPALLPYPVRIVVKYSDSSCQIIYQRP